MKKAVIFLSLIFFGLPFFVLAATPISAGGYEVSSFSSNLNIASDSKIKVQEKIGVNFLEARHGLYRYIPTAYKDSQGFAYNLRLKVLSVTNAQGNPYDIADQKQADPFYLKIGSANSTVIGSQEYNINYEVGRGIRYFDDHDELYWNVTGSSWDVPLNNVQATVTLPQLVEPSQLKIACYTGLVGSAEKNCNWKVSDNKIVQFFSNEPTGNGRDFTIVLGFPKGVVLAPSMIDSVNAWLFDNWGFFFPIITLIIMYLIWNKYGRDDKITQAIIPRYEEGKDLSPMLADNILRDKYDARREALSAEIVYLAVNGYIKIQETASGVFKTKDYQLIRLKPAGEDLKPYQTLLFAKLFDDHKKETVLISDLKQKFTSQLMRVKELVRSYLAKYYVTGPLVKVFVMTAGIIIMGGSYFWGNLSSRLDWFLGVLISGIIIAIFGYFMAKKSPEGNDLYCYVKGFREFIDTTDRDRVKFYEQENIFEKVLPYAMVFGLADKWGKAFEGLYTEPPSWYSGNWTTFNAVVLVHNLNSFTDHANSTVFAAPSDKSGFGGGGFSGGGFGGGGGGSW